MAIVGIERLIYGVEDLQESARFFRDFGLLKLIEGPGGVELGLVNGARVVLLPLGHPTLPRNSGIIGPGVQEVIWGVDSQASLEELRLRLEPVVEVVWDGEVLRFVAPFGVPMGLRVWTPKPIVCAPDPANAPGRVERLNRPRRWRLGAAPRLIAHVVFTVPGGCITVPNAPANLTASVASDWSTGDATPLTVIIVILKQLLAWNITALLYQLC